MHYQLGKAGTFDAAHRLRSHPGKCSNLHGHTWQVAVEIEADLDSGDVDNHDGMIVDYGDLKRAWTIWDHTTILNCSDPLVEPLKNLGMLVETFCWEPTAETIASLILEYVFDVIWQNGWTEGFLVTVSVQESESSHATVSSLRMRNDG